MKQTKMIIASDSAPRLDKYLVEELRTDFNFSRATIQKIISGGHVSINQKVVSVPKTPLVKGDQIIVVIPSVKTPKLSAKALNLEIIYQDNDFLVINKPNNLVVHPGAGQEAKTLVHGLLAIDTDLSNLDGWRPGIVHRLDKQTTGLLIVAKNNLTHRKLSEMFAQHEIKKEYLALVHGLISESAGKIEMPIGRSVTNRKKMAVSLSNSKAAITHFEVLERFANATLVKVNLETGRTHQIRVHFHQIKHPVYNDPIYGKSTATKDEFGQYLHASKLTFKHPTTGKLVEFSAPLPQQFDDKIKALRKNKDIND